jgi:hypothetical protein
MAQFAQNYWFRVKPDVKIPPFVQKTNYLPAGQLLDSGANLMIISGDVAEAYSNDLKIH